MVEVVEVFMAVEAAFTVGEEGDFIQAEVSGAAVPGLGEVTAAAFVADPLHRLVRARDFRAPRRVHRCALEVGHMQDPAAMDFGPPAAR